MRCLLITFVVYCFSLSTNAITNVKHSLACENNKLTLKCAKDTVVNILDGNYGRNTELICNIQPIHRVNCIQENTVDILIDLCEGKKHCEVVAENKVFGDNCFGTVKYLFALYRCVHKEEFKHSLACENKPVDLQCQRGKVIQVYGANYGRRSQITCTDGPIHHTNCVSDTSLSIVKKLCNDKKSCNIQAANNIFGDPCEGTHKYLSVKYKCIPGEAKEESQNTGLQCADGVFISPSLICDGKQDCIHGDDELVCPYETKHACEDGHHLNIKCRKKEIIKITNANYGRLSKKVCPHALDGNVNCKAVNSKQVVQQRCDGRNKCVIEPSNNVFGDPCPNIYKYLEAQYTCEPATGSHKVVPRSLHY